MIDFTVSTPAILTALTAFLPDNGSEIVLSDVNRTVNYGPLLRPLSHVALEQLTPTASPACRSAAVVNAVDDTDATLERTIPPVELRALQHPRGLPYLEGMFSLSYLAITIAPDDPLYGTRPDPASRLEFGLNLGTLDARGERSALNVDQDFLTRPPSNPFFPHLLARIDEGIAAPPAGSGRELVFPPSTGLPGGLEALLSTFAPANADAQRFAGS